MEIVRLQEKHLEEAADLFAGQYRKQRHLTPDLPSQYEDPRKTLPRMLRAVERGSGVAAFEDGKMIGYLGGALIDSFFGTHRGVYCPEWAHAAVGEMRPRTYEAMYKEAATMWVEEGCYNHAIILLAGDQEACDTWFWLGFGARVIDAVRPVTPIQCHGVASGIVIRPAATGDIDAILELSLPHQRYYAQSPTFLPLFELDDRPYFEEWLGTPGNVMWIAIRDGELVAFLWVKHASDNASLIVRDEKTAAIVGAFTKPGLRGNGIAAAMLAAAVEHAASSGYARMSVDFESANILGRRFWLKHFQPVCYSLTRHVDERIGEAANR